MSRLDDELLGLLPGKVLVGEVTVLCRLEVDGLGKVELLDNDTGTHIKVLVDDLHEFGRGTTLGGGAVILNEDGEGLSNTNGV